MGIARADLQFIPLPAPAEGRIVDVAPGVRWARFPLPFRLNHINVWLIDGSDGITIVDSGIADDRTRALWDMISAELGSPHRIARIVGTHHHPDHCGLIGWLSRRFEAPVAMSRNEWLLGQFYLHEDDPSQRDATERFFRRAGYREGFFDGQNVPFNSLTADFPDQFQRLVGGQGSAAGSDWKVMTFGGHAPEHVCLHNAKQKILIVGDQVLPAISPIIGVAPHQPDDDPLGDFLQSLDQLRRIPGDTVVLPSHGQPFMALHARIDALAAHHDRRLAQLYEGLSEPASAATLTKKLFPDVGPGFDMIFAVSETIAHARYLEMRGRIRRSIDAAGVELFHRIG